MPIHYYWMIAGIIFIILEVLTATAEFLFMSFGLASILTGCIAYLGVSNVNIQILIFIITSIIGFLTIRPIAKKYLYSKTDTKTNIDNYAGQNAKVIKKIDNSTNTGRIAIYGEEWNAKSLNNEIIEEQTIVKIVIIEDLTAIVDII